MRLPSSIELVVIDSGVPHAHAGGEYATRRHESFEAARLLDVERLRELDVTALPRLVALPPVLAGRARHVITDTQRVLDTVAALRAGDAERLGALFAAAHASMRDDYETSTPEVDTLVRIGQQHRAIYGARLTGGGFGGAVVLLARAGSGAAAGAKIGDEYGRETGRSAAVLVPLI